MLASIPTAATLQIMKPRFPIIPLLFLAFANFANVPSTEELKAEMERELVRKVESKIKPSELVAKYRLPSPVLPPTMSRAEIEAQIMARVAEELKAKFTDQEADFVAEAAEKFPLVELRDTISVQVKRGGVTKGVLYENNVSYIKVSSYRIHKVDLVGESLALVDKEANAKYRQKHVYKRKSEVEVGQAKLTDSIRQNLGKELFIKHGYVQRRDGWKSTTELLDAAVAHETKLLRKKYGPHVKQAVLERHGFTLVDGRWKRPEPTEVVAVAESEPEPQPEPGPEVVAVTPAPIPLPPDTPPEVVEAVQDAIAKAEEIKPSQPAPPATEAAWDWSLPSKAYSLTRDHDLTSREDLWEKRMAQSEPASRGYGWGRGEVDTLDPADKGKGKLQCNFVKVD